MSQTMESSSWILMEDNRQKRNDHQQANLKRTKVSSGFSDILIGRMDLW